MAAAGAMQWAKLRDPSHREFWRTVANEVKRAGGSQQNWSNEELGWVFHEQVLNGIREGVVRRYLNLQCKNLRGAAAHTAVAKEFVNNVIYICLSRSQAGVTHHGALELAAQARLGDVLACHQLGGHLEWTVEEFITADTWAVNGNQAGMKDVCKLFLTTVAAKGGVVPRDPRCPTCTEFCWEHRGARNMKPIPCACEKGDAATAGTATPKKPEASVPEGTTAGKRRRGFGNDLDPEEQNTLDCFDAKVKLIAERYNRLDPKSILKALLGVDVDKDEKVGTGVTGEQGGKLLGAYLYFLEQEKAISLLPDGAIAWLNEKRPRLMKFPAQKVCIDQALKWLPRLVKALAKKNKSDTRKASAEEVIEDLFDR